MQLLHIFITKKISMCGSNHFDQIISVILDEKEIYSPTISAQIFYIKISCLQGCEEIFSNFSFANFHIQPVNKIINELRLTTLWTKSQMSTSCTTHIMWQKRCRHSSVCIKIGHTRCCHLHLMVFRTKRRLTNI